MTPQKALEILEMFLHKQCDLQRTKFAYSDIEVYCAVSMAKNALKKQIPKKPIKKNPICYAQTKDGTEFIAYDYFCPDCNKQIKATEHHCKCGQALDWSDT